MTYDRAVSPFALSTFRDGLAFVLPNARSVRRIEPGGYLKLAPGSPRFRAIFGPPHGFETFSSAEVGRRHLGDRHCWTIMRTKEGKSDPDGPGALITHTHTDPMHPIARVKGPSFEALDWGMLHDKEGSYMKISEPFVWR